MKTTYKIILAFLLITTIGCSEDIINKNPLDEIAPEDFFNTEGGYRSALDGVYSIIQKDFLGYNFCILSIPEAINDDLKAGSPSGFTFENTHSDFYPLTYDATKFQTEGFWRLSYEALNNVNQVIKYARKGTISNVEPYLAEALGLRALLHYNLYRFFGKAYTSKPEGLAVPYRKETDVALEVKPRNTSKEVIELVLEDLKESALLATNDVNSYRLSKTGILALLARVYHESGDFENAIIYAEKALEDGRYELATSLEDLEKEWQLDESNEIIFRIRFEESDNGANAAVLAIPVYSSYPYYVSDDLLALYDQTNDYRFSTYFGTSPLDPSEYYPKKHTGIRTADPANFVVGAIDVKLIRVPELYLILAESYEKEANAGEARRYLNLLRNARGLVDYEGGDLLTEIYKERRRELAFEGFRFTDLKRLELGFTREDGTSMAAKDNRYALPIPQLEIDRSGIDQNPGY